jgi:hypothetical protein
MKRIGVMGMLFYSMMVLGMNETVRMAHPTTAIDELSGAS